MSLNSAASRARATLDSDRYWPGYDKHRINAADLRRRFTLEDLRRVTASDDGIARLLETLEIDG